MADDYEDDDANQDLTPGEYLDSGCDDDDDVDEFYYAFSGGVDVASPAYQPQLSSNIATPSATSEPGDYYDYGWDYEITPGAEVDYQRQQLLQQQRFQQLQYKQRRLNRPVSTSTH